MLRLPEYSKPFRIDLAADSSDVAVGAELLQNGQSVAFYSKKLTPTPRSPAEIKLMHLGMSVFQKNDRPFQRHLGPHLVFGYNPLTNWSRSSSSMISAIFCAIHFILSIYPIT